MAYSALVKINVIAQARGQQKTLQKSEKSIEFSWTITELVIYRGNRIVKHQREKSLGEDQGSVDIAQQIRPPIGQSLSGSGKFK